MASGNLREDCRLYQLLFLANLISIPSSLLISRSVPYLLEYAEHLDINFTVSVYVTAFWFKQFFRNFVNRIYDNDWRQLKVLPSIGKLSGVIPAPAFTSPIRPQRNKFY